MGRPLRSAVIAGLGAALLGATGAGAGEGASPGAARPAPGSAAGEKETALSIDQLPPGARRTAREQSKGAVVGAVSKEVDEKGRTVYEIAMKVDGRIRDIIVGAEGDLLVVEQEVPLAELPRAVRSAVMKAVGKRRLLFVESVTREGALAYYEAHAEARGKEVEIKVGLGGEVMAE